MCACVGMELCCTRDPHVGQSSSVTVLTILFLFTADDLRQKFMMDTLDTHQGMPRHICRANLFQDVMDTYRENSIEILNEFPFRIKFEKEKAVDTGGVSRDLFSAFWEAAYLKHFDGETLLVPAVHPNTEVTTFSVLGTVLSHGFMVSGFLPIRIAFPSLAAVLLGTDVVIPDAILIESLVDYIACHESELLRKAVTESSFSSTMLTKLINMLSRLGCTEIPSPSTLKRIMLSVARHQLISKPLGALFTMRSGVPITYHSFLKEFSIEELFRLYKCLNASPAKVLQLVEEPEFMNQSEESVYRYINTFIGNSKQEQLRLFLRYVTGSSVLIAKPIKITFNNLNRFQRRPISHTCDCTLELPICYDSFPDFDSELSAVLSSQMCFDSIMENCIFYLIIL